MSANSCLAVRRSLLIATLAVGLAAFSNLDTLCSQEKEKPKLFAGMKYRCIGPFRGGRVTAVAGVPGQPTVFYFGATGGGVWRTENAGVTWANLSDGQFTTGSIGSIAIAQSDSNVIYVGTGEGPIRAVTTSHGDGIYKSTDRGKTWKRIGLEKTRQLPAVRVHPQNPDIVYAAAQGSPWGSNSDRGIYRSTDGGANWRLVLHVDESTGACDLTMDSTNPRILYAAMWDHQRTPWQVRSGGPGSGIYKTTDAGDTWTKLEKGLPKTMGKVGVSVSPANPERIWAIIEADKGGLYRSDDAGKSWTLVNARRVLRARSWYYMHVLADPVDSETVYVLNAPMLKSTDGGNSFTQVSTPHGDNHALWIDPVDNRRMINGNDGGANVSHDRGKTWSTQMNQPTAQFYRVITDNQFPYHLYGGQQDNSTVTIASETMDRGIGSGDWESVGGGESAHVAFNPDDPTLIYATSIVGTITEYDRRTRMARNIQAYPEVGLGSDPDQVKYRFNWNAPVLVSMHNPEEIYHGGNVLLKSVDRGNSWQAISPDLTRNDPRQQIKGGVPFTNEAAGAEIYNTIFYVAESPHAAGTLWVGSDCGLVHVTTDGGGSWSNVTPPGLGEAQINTIEVSPHDNNTIYLAVTKYKLNDYTPLVYKTSDFGTSWQLITDGLDEDGFVRVVREDPVRKDLLFAGSENGLFFSVDAGRWQSLQLNLPAVPITDLRVKDNDLVVATQGRAFWILDDLSPLRQWNAEVATSEAFLYQPSNALRLNAADRFTSKPGKNPPKGGTIDFELRTLPEAEQTKVVLEILDAQDQVVRRMSNRKSERADAYESTREPHVKKPDPYGLLKLSEGTNRVVWDLRRENIPCIDGHLLPMGWKGPRVTPGEYRVRLSVGDWQSERGFRVLPDPRFSFAGEAVAEHSVVVRSIYSIIGDVHNSVVRMRQVRDQIEERLELAKTHSANQSIAAAGQEVIEALADWEQHVVQAQRETQQDMVNFSPGLSIQLVYLMNQADAGDPPITQGTRQRFADLQERWANARDQMHKIVNQEVASLNEALRQQGIPEVLIPDDKTK